MKGRLQTRKGELLNFALSIYRFVSTMAEPITDEVPDDKLLFFEFVAHSAPLLFAPHSFLSS